VGQLPTQGGLPKCPGPLLYLSSFPCPGFLHCCALQAPCARLPPSCRVLFSWLPEAQGEFEWPRFLAALRRHLARTSAQVWQGRPPV
jgi:hypothetical protein